jgi:hypothetical protein
MEDSKKVARTKEIPGHPGIFECVNCEKPLDGKGREEEICPECITVHKRISVDEWEAEASPVEKVETVALEVNPAFVKVSTIFQQIFDEIIAPRAIDLSDEEAGKITEISGFDPIFHYNENKKFDLTILGFINGLVQKTGKVIIADVEEKKFYIEDAKDWIIKEGEEDASKS